MDILEYFSIGWNLDQLSCPSQGYIVQHFIYWKPHFLWYVFLQKPWNQHLTKIFYSCISTYSSCRATVPDNSGITISLKHLIPPDLMVSQSLRFVRQINQTLPSCPGLIPPQSQQTHWSMWQTGSWRCDVTTITLLVSQYQCQGSFVMWHN